ncbi:MAG: bifunctional DNA primase/polymerase [Pseudomonadota bacterium]
MSTEPKDLAGLEGYYLIPLRDGDKRPKRGLTGWQHTRLTTASSEIQAHAGNIGLLLGPVYSAGDGFMELDIDDPEGLDPILECLSDHVLEIRSVDGIVNSGGRHRGRKVLIWVRAHGWEWRWPGKSTIGGMTIEVRGRGQYTLIPPSAPGEDPESIPEINRVFVPYSWVRPLPLLTQVPALLEDLPLDFELRLFRALYGEEPELPSRAGSRSPHSDDSKARRSAEPFSPELSQRLAHVLETLAGAGMKFGNSLEGSTHVKDGIILDEEGGVKCVVLHTCPACGGRGDCGDGRFERGKAWVTPAGWLKCFHATCSAAQVDDGLSLETWVRYYFHADAAAALQLPENLDPKASHAALHILESGGIPAARVLCPSQPSGSPVDQDGHETRGLGESSFGSAPGLSEHLMLEEGRDETRGLYWDALDRASGEPRALIFLDGPPGVSKSETMLQDAVSAARQGLPYPLFVKGHDLIDKHVTRAKEIAADQGCPDLEIVHLTGMARVCARWGDFPERARPYFSRKHWTLCQGCDLRSKCEYYKKLSRLGKNHVLVFAPHEMAKTVLNKYPNDRPAVFDELPTLYKIVDFPEIDLQAVKDAKFFPASTGPLRMPFDLWYGARARAATKYLELVRASELSLPKKQFRHYLFGQEMWRVLPAGFEEALNYDPTAGEHPSYKMGKDSSGWIPKPGLHIRQDFDNLQRVFQAWIAGTSNIEVGEPALYRDEHGNIGLAVLQCGMVLPEDRGVVVLAAGATDLEPLLRRIWSHRTVEVCSVRVLEPEWVERLGLETGEFSKKRLQQDPSRRRKALRSVFMRLLPHLMDLRARHNLSVLTIGITCPLILEKDIRDRTGEVGEALDLLRQWGCHVVPLAHFGNLEGSNDFNSVAVLLILGDAIPNLSESDLLAHGLLQEVPGGGPATTAPTGNEIVGMLTDYRFGQIEGRARCILRTRDNPVLIVHAGKRLQGYERRELCKGASPLPNTVVAEVAAGEMLRVWGWTAPQAVAAIVKSVETRTGPGFGHNWKTVGSPLRLASLFNCVQTHEPRGAGTRRELRAVVSAARRYEIRTGVHVPHTLKTNPQRSGSWTVYEVVPGTYHAWCAAQDTEA